MKSNELRIGNWYLGASRQEPLQATARFIQQLDEGLINCSPIPLTPEILEKCGFVSNPYQDRFELGQVHIQYCGVRNMFWIENYSAELKSLHQLQNSTYALTGEELIFKP